MSTIVPFNTGEKVYVQFALPGHEAPFLQTRRSDG
jgi:hypothetical protein